MNAVELALALPDAGNPVAPAGALVVFHEDDELLSDWTRRIIMMMDMINMVPDFITLQRAMARLMQVLYAALSHLVRFVCSTKSSYAE
jgi:hypothetical protein